MHHVGVNDQRVQSVESSVQYCPIIRKLYPASSVYELEDYEQEERERGLAWT
jgi:hypothetical protein